MNLIMCTVSTFLEWGGPLFFQLCDIFHSRELVTDSIHASVEEQVAMFLHVVGHNERFRVVDLTFRRPAETISRFFQKVLYAVGELRNELIVPPATNVHPRILGSRRWYPYFKVGVPYFSHEVIINSHMSWSRSRGPYPPLYRQRR